MSIAHQYQSPVAPPIYVVLHFYKTAGLTLRGNFRANFKGPPWLPMYAKAIGLDLDKREGSSANPGWIAERVDDYVRTTATTDTRCVFGHMAYVGVHELVPGAGEPRYIAFLRDPVERIISLYSYLKHDATNYWHREIIANHWTLEEWVANSPALWIRDGQLRQLLIGGYPEVEIERGLTAEHLAEGRRRLQRFWFVGLTENFTQDAQTLYEQIGFTRFYRHPVVNATTQKEQVSPAVREQILGCNHLDMELYEFARSLRREMIHR